MHHHSLDRELALYGTALIIFDQSISLSLRHSFLQFLQSTNISAFVTHELHMQKRESNFSPHVPSPSLKWLQQHDVLSPGPPFPGRSTVHQKRGCHNLRDQPKHFRCKCLETVLSIAQFAHAWLLEKWELSRPIHDKQDVRLRIFHPKREWGRGRDELICNSSNQEIDSRERMPTLKIHRKLQHEVHLIYDKAKTACFFPVHRLANDWTSNEIEWTNLVTEVVTSISNSWHSLQASIWKKLIQRSLAQSMTQC